MAFLTIAGQDIDVLTEGARRAENIYIGSRNVRTFSGSLTSTVRSEKRQWELPTAPMLAAAVATLRGNIANNAFVTCSGTFLGGSISCSVSITQEQFIPDGSAPTIYRSLLQLVLIEV